MAIRVGINGFGRIGRGVFRASLDRDDIHITLVNDIADSSTLAHLLKYDSIHGTLPVDVEAADNVMSVDGVEIDVTSFRDPAELPWRQAEVDVVVESTGRFRDRDSASKHLDAGAPRVIISAPAESPDYTVVLGVNESGLDLENHRIISNASCTTNCLAPLMRILDEELGVERAFLNTVHSYTNDQRILDRPHSDPRRARAAAANMIPTTTGAIEATMSVMPQLKDKLDGMAVRVPTSNVSLIDLVAIVETETSRDEVNQIVKSWCDGELSGIVEYTEESLVSSDFNGNPSSAIFDAPATKVSGRKFLKLLAWYDNESGYSHRINDLIAYIENH